MTSYPETRASLIVLVKDSTNQAAWTEFVDIYTPVIYRTAVKRGLQDADAHDLTQQVLISVASAVGRWEKAGTNVKFRHWLRRITRNAIVNALARKPLDRAVGSSSANDVLGETPQPDSQADELIQLEFRRELFLRAVEIVRTDVAPETWQAFELTTIGGMNRAEAARQLGKSIGTVYAARSRVMKRLRDAVAEMEASQQ